MNAFRDYYKNNIYKENAQARLQELDFLINDIIYQMTQAVSPTVWNQLLNRKEELEIERADLSDAINGLSPDIYG